MASTPRNTEALTLRLERQFAARLREEAKRLQMANLQELIRKLLEELLAKSNSKDVTATSSTEPDIDLRTLLIEAHKANTEANKIIGEANRTIAELTRTITAMTQEQKNAPAEPAGIVESTGSTVESKQSGRSRVTAILQGMEPRERERLISDIRSSGSALSR